MPEPLTAPQELPVGLRDIPEALYYLQEFQEQEAHRFAVIKVSGGTLADPEELAAIVDSIQALYQSGLTPVIVHGGKPQIDQALETAHLVRSEIDGLRVTPEPAVSVIAAALSQLNTDFVATLNARGVGAVGFPQGIVKATPKNIERYGFVGDPTPEQVDVGTLKDAAEKGFIPIVSCLGLTSAGEYLNVNADDAARARGEAIDPLKYVAITPTGGIEDSAGNIIGVITLVSGQLEELTASGVLKGGMLKKAQESQKLIGKRLHTEVVYTAAKSLLHELFSHEGKGTLITNSETTNAYEGFNGIDETKIRIILEACFGSVAWDVIAAGVEKVIVTNQTYHGVAIVKRLSSGQTYMDKLAVIPKAQGRGVSETLLERVAREYPDGFYWRSRVEKEALRVKYKAAASKSEEVMGRDGQAWVIFWHHPGDEVPEDFDKVADEIANLPTTVGRSEESTTEI